ncbi:predicted protein [Phaeodactylum tricornutum CCAP 1055/1]|uniref:Uncharacterized protein n=1 Tax=Phaeodactylum tricornutum (strain CCAP 1055/1) TaxID=556484 RepID=B7FSF6_PHATC|nr:predicted protein [Phaeodactylum tricornutum CCAP 1055/1]EEC50469.1 predicted protein [Phaeodactylum tricornutum CCAP 1055/1]|eukprot:XP_002177655.1 predicted protein [Phaeodactylum tricornutum CCAP 1055/1]
MSDLPPPPRIVASINEGGLSRGTASVPASPSQRSNSLKTPTQSPSIASKASSIKSDNTPRQRNFQNSVPQKHIPVFDSPSKGLSRLRPSLGRSPLPNPKAPSKCPLFGAFYAEFDNNVGPKVCYESPTGFMDQDINAPLEAIHDMLAKTFARLEPKMGFKETSSSTKDALHTSSKKKEAVWAKRASARGSGRQQDPIQSDEATTADHSVSIFDSCSDFIITGSELTGKIINLSTHRIHLLTRPTVISDERYERNSLLFCVGFVLRRTEDPRPFRPVLSKLALTLRDMERETQFLSKKVTRPQLQDLLENILVSLNSSDWECNVVLNQGNFLNLKLFHPPKLPVPPVPEFAVPVLLRRDWQLQSYDWDLAINWVSLHIDGTTNARQIAKRAEVDMEMVQACLRVLKHHGVIALVDMFFYSNRYEATSKATTSLTGVTSELLSQATAFALKKSNFAAHDNSPSTRSRENSLTDRPEKIMDNVETHASSYPSEQNEIAFGGYRLAASVTSNNSYEMASYHSSHSREEYNDVKLAVAELYCACGRSRSLGELWIRLISGESRLGQLQPHFWRRMFHLIDHRRFACFGVAHGLLKRVHNFPLIVDARGREVLTSNRHLSGDETLRHSRSALDLKKERLEIERMIDGKHCDDDLACEFERSIDDIFELLGSERIVSVYATAF